MEDWQVALWAGFVVLDEAGLLEGWELGVMSLAYKFAVFTYVDPIIISDNSPFHYNIIFISPAST